MKLLRPIILVQTFVLLLAAGIAIPPLVLAYFIDTTTIRAFIWVEVISIGLALTCYALTRRETFAVFSKQLYLITVTSWCTFALVGSVPLYEALPGLSFTDAFFESMSGITTTGSTVLTGLDIMPMSILLWRGFLQWIGGIGIIVLAIAILPFLRVGGMRLFSTESSDWSGKSAPRAQILIRNIGLIYITLTLMAALTYWASGMGPFDAVVHAMTTLSTGGYANYDASMGHFKDSPTILWAATLFMILGALPFLLYTPLFQGKARPLIGDKQVRGFILFILTLAVFLSFERTINGQIPFFQALTQVTFNIVSIITTTGYASEDYTQWGDWAIVVFFYLMFVGGCSGSTTGSIKFFRYQIALVMLRQQLHLMRHPGGVFTSKYNDRVVIDDIIRSIIAFSFFFALTIAVIALLLSLTGLDFVTSLSAATTAVTNVGPGLGNVVGPSGSFASLTETAKWTLCLGMLMGRLEIMTVLVLFTSTFWRT